jgi:NAD(P)-dependent dehydrogenase (short-subunit alcohol dehydrogenase family)
MTSEAFFMSLRLSNLVITGACGGLGRAMALAALTAGNRFAIPGLRAQAAHDGAERRSAEPPHASTAR